MMLYFRSFLKIVTSLEQKHLCHSYDLYYFKENHFQKLHAIVDGLEPNREYSFRVNAFNRNGDGEFSESRSIVTGGIR